MKNLVLSLSLATIALFSHYSVATPTAAPQSCGERLRAVVEGVKTDVGITRSTFKIAGIALSHYREEININDLSLAHEAYVDSVAEYRSADGKLLGYKVSVTDGGDESMVDYIIDHQRKLVSAYWHNQSPVRFWFCK